MLRTTVLDMANTVVTSDMYWYHPQSRESV
jgi:hypothetical protein